MYDAVVFDFFGVIFDDPMPAWAKRHGLENEKRVAETARLLDTGAILLHEYMEHLSSLSGESAEDVERYFASATLLKPETVTIIRELGRHRPIGLLSNTTPDEINPLLYRHNLRELFQTVTISAEIGVAKPDPEIFNVTLRHLGSEPQKTLFIDDNYLNIAAAKRIGIAGVVFEGAAQLRYELQQLGILVSKKKTESQSICVEL